VCQKKKKRQQRRKRQKKKKKKKKEKEKRKTKKKNKNRKKREKKERKSKKKKPEEREDRSVAPSPRSLSLFCLPFPTLLSCYICTLLFSTGFWRTWRQRCLKISKWAHERGSLSPQTTDSALAFRGMESVLLSCAKELSPESTDMHAGGIAASSLGSGNLSVLPWSANVRQSEARIVCTLLDLVAAIVKAGNICNVGGGGGAGQKNAITTCIRSTILFFFLALLRLLLHCL